MAAIRSFGTSPEQRLGIALRELFPRRRITEGAVTLPGKPDFYLPSLRLAIFVDGCFWHCCPEHGRMPGDNRDYWEPKLARNVARDREAVLALRRRGIRPLRLWEHEVRVKAIATAIHRVAITAGRPPLQPCRASRAERRSTPASSAAAMMSRPVPSPPPPEGNEGGRGNGALRSKRCARSDSGSHTPGPTPTPTPRLRPALFQLGQIVATPGAIETLNRKGIKPRRAFVATRDRRLE